MQQSADTIKIVLLDDDIDEQVFFEDALIGLSIPYEFQYFNNSMDLLDYLNSELVQLPDILFLDLNMPKLNGFETLKILRETKKLKNLPVAVYSNSFREKDLLDSLGLGANAYILKPGSHTELKSVLTKVIQHQWQFHSGLTRETFIITAS